MDATGIKPSWLCLVTSSVPLVLVVCSGVNGEKLKEGPSLT